MNPVCPAAIDPATLARDVLTTADCLIAGQVADSYAALLAPGGVLGTALTLALTIYVAIFGYRLMLGLSRLTLGEVVPHFIKIGIIVALVTSWPSYQTLVFNLLFNGPQQLASALAQPAVGTGGTNDVMLALQALFDRLTDAASDAWAQGNAAPPVTPTALPAPVAGASITVTAPAVPALPFALGAAQFVAILLWLSALVLMAMSVGLLLVVRIVLALLLVVGPLFIALALFRPSRGLAEGWLRTTVKFALVPLFALPLIVAVIAVAAPLTEALGEAPIVSVREGPTLLIVLVVMVFAAVMIQAARLGGSIASGIRLPRSNAPAAESTGMAPVAIARGATPAPTASRAETIVRAIDSGGRGSPGAGAAPITLAASRTITVPAAGPAGIADAGNRLGQGYRRLAVAPRT